MSIKHYASDLTDKQWHLIAPHMPPEKERGRPRATDFRMDSQSVKTASVAESSGFDGAKLGRVLNLFRELKIVMI